MIKVYINYPHHCVTIHHNMNCNLMNMHPNLETRRFVSINLDNLGGELKRFSSGEFRFASIAGLNGLWLCIDLGDDEFEAQVAAFILRQLSSKYTPFRSITPNIHCYQYSM